MNVQIREISEKVKDIIKNNNLVVMREKSTGKALGLAYTEEGLRATANKNGVYLYCKGRVNNYFDALSAKKSDKIIVEKFVPKQFDNPTLSKIEMHWVEAAIKKLY